MPTSAGELLRVSDLLTGYGKVIVLRGIDITVGAGEIVTLLGPNGAGKTTLLRAVSGLLPWSGSVQFAGHDLLGAGPRETAKAAEMLKQASNLDAKDATSYAKLWSDIYIAAMEPETVATFKAMW